MIFDSYNGGAAILVENEGGSIFNLDKNTDYNAINEGAHKTVYEIEAELERLKSGKSTKFYDFFGNCFVLLNMPFLLINTFNLVITCMIMGLGAWGVHEAKNSSKKNQLDRMVKQCDSTIKSLEKSNDPNKKQKIAELNKLRSKITSEYVKVEKDSKNYKKDVDDELKAAKNISKKAHEAYMGYAIRSDSNYIYEAYYQDYIDNMISNEEALARQLNSIIPMNEAAYKNVRVMNEAKLGDNIKAKCNKFLDFIKNLIAKFMESISSVLLSYKDYLKKYEDIIKKKTPKSELKYSYNGDYKEGIRRCIDLQVPVFNYDDYHQALADKDEATVVNKIMEGKTGFTYDDGTDNLSTMFKSYFLALDKGESSGPFSDLNFTDMYNFCYNSEKIDNIVKKDQQHMETSTKEIVNAATTKINNAAAAKQQQQGVIASTVYTSYSSYVNEANPTPPTNNPSPTPQQTNTNNNQQQPKTTNLKINTDAVSQMSTYDNRDAVTKDDAEKAVEKVDTDTETENSINTMADEWMRICRVIFAAKITAVEQIAKDYMAIIREHVRSYTGKKDDVADTRKAQTATDYSRNNNNNNNQNNNNQNTMPNKKEKGTLNQQEIAEWRKAGKHTVTDNGVLYYIW